LKNIKIGIFDCFNKKIITLLKIKINMVASLSAQDQIAATMAVSMPETILAFKFSPSIQERIEVLVHLKKENKLSASEKEELDKYLAYDLLIGLAKARAIQHLNKHD
jgi:hypothetical protein